MLSRRRVGAPLTAAGKSRAGAGDGGITLAAAGMGGAMMVPRQPSASRSPDATADHSTVPAQTPPATSIPSGPFW